MFKQKKPVTKNEIKLKVKAKLKICLNTAIKDTVSVFPTYIFFDFVTVMLLILGLIILNYAYYKGI